jgi:hypothetical protein
MAFKGLEDRFLANAKKLYAEGSTKDGSKDQPFLEWKPDDPNARETAHDTQLLPLGSQKRDLSRIGRFLKSNDGIVFLVRSEVLQTGNVFSETRIINPAFVLGSVIPGEHIPHPLTGQNAFAVRGDTTNVSPASLDPKIFSAGRLQVSTAKQVTANVVGTPGKSGLLSMLSLNSLKNVIGGIFSIADNGSLGVDQRPELNVDGDYFSVQLWKGFSKVNSTQSNLNSAAANLRIGNLKGALNSLKQAAKSFITGTPLGGIIPSNPLKADGRDSDSWEYDGRRYFFSNAADDERYLPNSIQFTADSQGHDRPSPHLGFLNRQPYTLDGLNVVQQVQATAFAAAKSRVPDITKGLRSAAGSVAQVASSVGLSFNQQALQNVKNQLAAVSPEAANANPAENHMRFPDLSLAQRYNTDERISFIRDTLDKQQASKFAYWQQNKPKLGFVESKNVNVGAVNNPDPRVYRGPGGYLQDSFNTQAVYDSTGDTVSAQTLSDIRQGAEDAILVIFYDFVNKKAVPFRAFISGLTQNVKPEISDTRYIGRIERNIVYAGVTRDVSFQLRVQAFSQAELDVVWQKVNYVTGLTFPAMYSNGYMVPPLVRLSLGDVYKDQPGYFTSLSSNIEDNTSWETRPDVGQLPHGVIMNIGFSIIETRQVRTGDQIFGPVN